MGVLVMAHPPGRAGASDRPSETVSLVQHAINTVTDHIRDQNLRVGDTLPGEAHFAGTLGVSRAVMREAFGALAALRLIDVGNGRKARVGAIDGSVIASSLDHAVSTAQITVPEVWDVRRTIEARTVALAASHRTDAEAAEIVRLAEAMVRDVEDRPQMTRHDIAFHQAIAHASHNALFVQIVSSFSHLMETAVPAAWDTRVLAEDKQATLDRHLAVACAIRDQDPAAAVLAMQTHFDASIDVVLRGMSAPTGMANDA
ncbi:FadR/GntR family transcriptional regulator [soil metagenome]